LLIQIYFLDGETASFYVWVLAQDDN